MSAQCWNCRQRPAAAPDGRCQTCAGGAVASEPTVAGAPPGPVPGYGYPGHAAPGAPPGPVPGAPPGPVPGYGYPGALPQQPPQFSSPQGLSTALMVLFGLAIALWLMGLFTGIDMLSTLDDLESPEAFLVDMVAAQDTLDAWQGIAVVQAVLMLATGVVFIVWFHRVRVNAELFDPAGQRLGRGWAIGAWFVPVISFWFPKQIANDAWRSSTPWGGHARLGVVTAWWLLWLATALTSFHSLTPDDDGSIDFDEFDETRVASWLTVVNGVVGMAAAILAILFVRQMTQRQLVKYAQGPQPWTQGPWTQGPWAQGPGAYPGAQPGGYAPFPQPGPFPQQAPPQYGQQPYPQPPGQQPPGSPPPPF